MDVAVTAMLGVSDPFGRIMVMPGLLHAPASLIRPQVNTRATSLRPDGLAWEEHAADTSRFPGPAGRLLIEGQRTNQVRNPRCEGAIPGLPGTMPTTWVPQAPSGGLQRQVVGTGTEGGIPYVDLRLFGTTTGANAAWRVDLLPVNQVSAAQGQVWTSSAFVRRIAGAFPTPGSAVLFVQEFSAAGGQINQSGTSFVTATNAPLASQRFSHTRTLTQAGTAFVAITVFFNVDTPGTVVDVTLRFGLPQLEQGPFASSPILPPIGTPGASTRGTDIVAAPLSSLGIGGNGACTVLWSGMIPQAAPISVQQSIAQIDLGFDSDRFQLRMAAGSSDIEIIRANLGMSQIVPVGGTTPGTPFRAGFTVDGAGRMAASVNGGAIAVATGGPTSGFTTFRLGARAGADQNMFGETAHLRVLPFALADSALQGAIAALPA